MREEEKKQFTDETICGRIRSDITDCYLACAFAVLFVGVGVGFFSWVLSLTTIKSAIWVIVSAGIIILALTFFKNIKKALYLRAILKNKAFTVHEDTLERIGENEFNSTYGPLSNRYVTAFYFSRFGRYVPPFKTEDYSSVGDVFYVVSYDCDSENPIFIAPKKIYDYKK